MDVFSSRGMVGRGSTTKDWFKSTDRFEQEIGARVNRQDRQRTFADCNRVVQDARQTLTHLLILFLACGPAILKVSSRFP